MGAGSCSVLLLQLGDTGDCQGEGAGWFWGKGTQCQMDLTFGVPHGTLIPVGRKSVGRRACRPGAQRQTHSFLPPRQKTQLLTGSGARNGTQTRSVWQEGGRG